jgi:putative transposase
MGLTLAERRAVTETTATRYRLASKCVSRHHFRTRADARAVVVPWSQDFHNVKRRHSSAALLAPDEYERIPAIQPDAA